MVFHHPPLTQAVSGMCREKQRVWIFHERSSKEFFLLKNQKTTDQEEYLPLLVNPLPTVIVPVTHASGSNKASLSQKVMTTVMIVIFWLVIPLHPQCKPSLCISGKSYGNRQIDRSRYLWVHISSKPQPLSGLMSQKI